ncbi:hypothetical protein NM688_g1171 [Phlebia brevispora]|uniref:Uncharacterized protein n=1 Tax=Phlebia brevispora TaxID=194682 RepID=A0ACC1TCF4_9APHY|nr:hypothetical protein NM688_g1171 [Phlebia brevispora]
MCHFSKSKEFCTLIFDNQRPRVAGELLEGEAELFLSLLSENRVLEVYVELRGTITTRLRIPRNSGTHTTQETVELVRTSMLLWSRATKRTASEGYLKVPFQFILPSGIPPSCSFSKHSDLGEIAYCIRVVGVRPVFYRNYTTNTYFPVLPVDIRGYEVSKSFEKPWTGEWCTLEKERDLQRTPVEGFAHAKMTVKSNILTFPKLDAYPILTPIPFNVDITTLSEHTELANIPHDGRPIFPCPPTTTNSTLTFRLERKVQLKAHTLEEIHHDVVAHLGGFGSKSKYWHPSYTADQAPLEKDWVPADDGGGKWKQHVHFASNFVLNCAPSFESMTMGVDYSLVLKVEFPGENHLKIECPVDIVSNKPAPATEAHTFSAANSKCLVAVHDVGDVATRSMLCYSAYTLGRNAEAQPLTLKHQVFAVLRWHLNSIGVSVGQSSRIQGFSPLIFSAMTLLHPSEEVVSLIFPEHLRVAGDVIEGEVDLNFRMMQHSSYEQVQVKLFGSIFTKISRAAGYMNYITEESVTLVRDSTTLWRHGEAYPPPGTDILKLPFRFTLPSRGIYPSCSFDNKYDLCGKVIYWVEVNARRTGLHLNKCIPRIFPVLPLDTPGAQLSRALRSGWEGPWRQYQEVRAIRKGMWGEYSNAKWMLKLPAVDVYPIFTPIPFILEIVTLSKPMKREDVFQGAVFPAPPHSPRTGVELKLVRDVSIKAQHQDGTSFGSLVAYLGGFAHDESAGAEVQTEIPESIWIPDQAAQKKHLGTFKQAVTFKSSFTFHCAPTFMAETMSVRYTLELKVEFPGVGNNVRGRVPLQLVSNASSSGSEPPARLWDAPPEIELPPAYFSSTNWNGHRKDSSNSSV